MNNKNIEDAYPLSHLQEGLLFHSLYAPDDGVYVTQVSCTMDNVEISLLEHVWRQVMDRHPILRTAFVWKTVKQPLQVVGRQVKLPLTYEDWQGQSSAEQEQRFQTYLVQDRTQGFNLSRPPLMRMALFQIAEARYKFVWSHHHILLDGWSAHALMNEVFALYVAACIDQSLTLPSIRPYRDYIAWLKQQDRTAADKFWRQLLQGFTAPTSLGVDQPQGNLSDGEKRFDDVRISLSEEVTASLQAFARNEQLTMNTVVQGAWAILLSRYSGVEDVVFGSVVAGRPTDLLGVQAMIGLFINTLPVRVNVSSDAVMLPWLKTLQAQQVDIQQYEYSSLVQVQGVSDVPRGLPLFESIFTFENYPVGQPMLEHEVSLDAYDFQVVEQNSYPLAVIVSQSDTLSLRLKYDCDRFDLATIEQMLVHLQTIVESMPTHSAQQLYEVPMMTAAEMQQLMMGGVRHR